jgi:hypothetical protein
LGIDFSHGGTSHGGSANLIEGLRGSSKVSEYTSRGVQEQLRATETKGSVAYIQSLPVRPRL